MKTVLMVYVFPLFFYVAVFLAVFYRIFFLDSHFLTHDNFSQFYVYFLRNHLWEPDLGYGFPAFAEPQWQIFYPFKYLFPENETGFDYYILHFLVIAAYFTYLVAYHFTKDIPASLAAGSIFSLSGSVSGQISMLSVVAGSSYIPAVWYFYLRFLETKKRTNFFLWIVSISLHFLSGHPQFFFHGFLFLFFFTVFYFFFEERKRNIFLNFFSSYLLGILLVSFAFLPQWELSQFTLRKDFISFSRINDFEFPARNAITLFFPFFWGGIGDGFLFTYILPEFRGFSHNFHEHFRYFGLLPFLLIFFLRKLEKKYLFSFFLFAIILYGIWVLGSQTVFSKIVYNIPVLNKFRGPSRHFLEITLIMSIMTSIALHKLRESPPGFSPAVVAAFLVLFLLLSLFFFRELREYYTPESFLSFSFAKNNGILFQLLFLFLFLVLLYGKIHNSLKIPLAVFLSILDPGINLQYSDALLYRWDENTKQTITKDQEILHSILGKEKEELASFRFFRNNFCVRYEIGNCSFLQLVNNFNALYGYKSSSIYNPLMDIHLGKLFVSFLLHPGYLPQWNNRLFVFDARGITTNYFGNIEINPFHTLPLILSYQDTGSEYSLLIPKELLKDTTFREITLYLSFEVENLKKEPAVKISLPDYGIYQILEGITDIATYKNHCEKTSKNQLQRKNYKDCDNIYIHTLTGHFSIRKHIEISLQALVPGRIHIYAIQLKNEKENLLFDPKFFLKTYFQNPEAEIRFHNTFMFVVFKNPLPRIFFPESIVEYDKEKLLYEMQFQKKEIDLIRRSYIHSSFAGKEMHFPAASRGKITVLEDTPERIRIKTETQGESFLVLHDFYYPSWIATINDKPTQIYNVNVIGRGIFVPEGENTVEFRFYSRTLLLGIVVSGITLAVIVFLLIRETKTSPVKPV